MLPASIIYTGARCLTRSRVRSQRTSLSLSLVDEFTLFIALNATQCRCLYQFRFLIQRALCAELNSETLNSILLPIFLGASKSAQLSNRLYTFSTLATNESAFYLSLKTNEFCSFMVVLQLTNCQPKMDCSEYENFVLPFGLLAARHLD